MRAARALGRFGLSLVHDIGAVLVLAACLVLASFDDDSRPY